jgi:pimeloyl-ACP methyl ester carboxylesterase
LQARLHLVAPAGGDPSRIPNLVPVSYGWRLSNRYKGQRLKTIVEPALSRWRAQGAPYAEAKVIFICHSMGGLVARWYIEKACGAEVTRKLVTFGTPYRGALSALDQLVNGVRKEIGLKVRLLEDGKKPAFAPSAAAGICLYRIFGWIAQDKRNPRATPEDENGE